VINPKHERHFAIHVYTSLEMTKGDFLREVCEKLVLMEASLNEDMRFRWHIEAPEEMI